MRSHAHTEGPCSLRLNKLKERNQRFLEGLDAFFDNVLVNADTPAVRANRLALLGQLKAQFSAVADIALL